MSSKETLRQVTKRLGLDGDRPNQGRRTTTGGEGDNLVFVDKIGIYLTQRGHQEYTGVYTPHKKEPVSLEKIKEEYKRKEHEQKEIPQAYGPQMNLDRQRDREEKARKQSEEERNARKLPLEISARVGEEARNARRQQHEEAATNQPQSKTEEITKGYILQSYKVEDLQKELEGMPTNGEIFGSNQKPQQAGKNDEPVLTPAQRVEQRAKEIDELSKKLLSFRSDQFGEKEQKEYEAYTTKRHAKFEELKQIAKENPQLRKKIGETLQLLDEKHAKRGDAYKKPAEPNSRENPTMHDPTIGEFSGGIEALAKKFKELDSKYDNPDTISSSDYGKEMSELANEKDEVRRTLVALRENQPELKDQINGFIQKLDEIGTTAKPQPQILPSAEDLRTRGARVRGSVGINTLQREPQQRQKRGIRGTIASLAARIGIRHRERPEVQEDIRRRGRGGSIDISSTLQQQQRQPEPQAQKRGLRGTIANWVAGGIALLGGIGVPGFVGYGVYKDVKEDGRGKSHATIQGPELNPNEQILYGQTPEEIARASTLTSQTPISADHSKIIDDYARRQTERDQTIIALRAENEGLRQAQSNPGPTLVAEPTGDERTNDVFKRLKIPTTINWNLHSGYVDSSGYYRPLPNEGKLHIAGKYYPLRETREGNTVEITKINDSLPKGEIHFDGDMNGAGDQYLQKLVEQKNGGNPFSYRDMVAQVRVRGNDQEVKEYFFPFKEDDEKGKVVLPKDLYDSNGNLIKLLDENDNISKQIELIAVSILEKPGGSLLRGSELKDNTEIPEGTFAHTFASERFGTPFHRE